jgi:hypothetical protein
MDFHALSSNCREALYRKQARRHIAAGAESKVKRSPRPSPDAFGTRLVSRSLQMLENASITCFNWEWTETCCHHRYVANFALF